jgi:hypothetical protein
MVTLYTPTETKKTPFQPQLLATLPLWPHKGLFTPYSGYAYCPPPADWLGPLRAHSPSHIYIGPRPTYHHRTVTPLKMEPTLVTETSEVKTQTPGKFPEESTLESQRGKSLKTYRPHKSLTLTLKSQYKAKF